MSSAPETMCPLPVMCTTFVKTFDTLIVNPYKTRHLVRQKVLSVTGKAHAHTAVYKTMTLHAGHNSAMAIACRVSW